MYLSKKIFTAAILVISIKLAAQSVTYNILENDPDKRKVFIHLNPFNTQGYVSDITIGYNIQATWLMAKHLQVEVDYRKAYLDGNATGVFSPAGLKKSSQLHLGGVLNLIKKLKPVNNKVILKSTSDSRYRYTTSITVRAEARKIFGIRGGFISFYSNHKVDNDITESFDENSLRGKASDGQIRYLRDTINFETINYTARSLGMYAGIDYKSIRNVIINADGYGKKSNKTENNIYADVLFTPSVKYELKPNSKQPMFNNVDINIPENKRKMLGWRVGWHFTYNYGLGFNAKMELGQQPGIASKSFFVTIGFGATIGFKTKEIPL